MPRPVPEVNSSSQADIAFMLLIFFLVTTTMDVDSGISRVLPPPAEDDTEKSPDQQIHERNILEVLVNRNDNLSLEGRRADLSELKDKVKEFFLNPNNDPDLPERRDAEIEYYGSTTVSKGVISLMNDRGTSYGMYIKVQNEIARAVNELRNEEAIRKFGKPYESLDEDKKKAIKKYLPNAVSEAEPEEIKED
ncbi:MAG: biopolymer transporter ExbD [Bacteroidales bacterium]|jgi:biopolymer transport protein ExbD|nr:biopolymer transporter ExbD [Bacteroidales bacterium]